ncbi:DUF2169 family type VI secretion system accessory protein [Tahibacter caeni]|uniref:DUF2169 family type VI secretion system accessory protein n=1 Tax=Tahibacter caeni TaxID=1453545 RepID=UPI00214781CA
MTTVVSNSLYPVQGVEHRFYHGNRYHCVSAKVTLQWDDEGRLHSVAKQPDWVRNDLWRARENRSGLLVASELIPFKPTTDVLVVGSVRPPDGRPARSWAGALIVGTREKRLRFHGPRRWRHGLMSGWTLSEPEPCEQVSLSYENAYGGVVEDKEEYADGEFHPANPLGCGYVGRHRPDTSRTYRAPQIEAWDSPVVAFGRDAAVGGLGPLPGFFPERLKYAGTYDSAWEADVKPDIPLDMDMRYWQTAPEDQRSDDYLRAGDTISLVGLRPGNPLTLELPPFDPALVCDIAGRPRESRRMNLDTVSVDLDRRHLVLRYHRIVAFDAALESIRVHCAPYKPLSGEVRHG